MRRDKYRQSDEKKFNTLYGSNFSRDTRELTPEQRRYLEIVEEERKYRSSSARWPTASQARS